jgi:hypothetical protein
MRYVYRVDVKIIKDRGMEMDNLVILCVITSLMIVASYILSICWHDFTRGLVQVKKRVSKSNKST